MILALRHDLLKMRYVERTVKKVRGRRLCRAGTRAEERMLRDKFGDAYDAYAKKKGRLVPGL